MSDNNLNYQDEEKQIIYERKKKMDEFMEKLNAEPKTNILKNLTFKNKLSEEIFKKLPYSDAVLERMVLELRKEGKI